MQASRRLTRSAGPAWCRQWSAPQAPSCVGEASKSGRAIGAEAGKPREECARLSCETPSPVLLPFRTSRYNSGSRREEMYGGSSGVKNRISSKFCVLSRRRRAILFTPPISGMCRWRSGPQHQKQTWVPNNGARYVAALSTSISSISSLSA
jgi:hypothetical protein